MEKSKRILNQMVLENDDKAKNWDERFLGIAKQVLTWSSCVRPDRQTGAVIVKDKRIIATGYNGAPAGIKSCKEKGYCYRKQKGINSGTCLELCYANHAEQNALMQAAKQGIAVEGATLYTTKRPCINCLKLIINSGIKRIVYATENYNNEVVDDILNQCDIEICYLPDKK